MYIIIYYRERSCLDRIYAMFYFQIGYTDISRAAIPNCDLSILSPVTIPTDLEWSTCTSLGGQSILVIAGSAPLSVYETLLRTVQYSITAPEPDKSVAQRQLSVS